MYTISLQFVYNFITWDIEKYHTLLPPLSLQFDSPVNLDDYEDKDDQIELEKPEYNDNDDDDDVISISQAKKRARLTCV